MEKRYDRIIIEFQKDNQCVVSAALSDADLDLLQNMHGQEKHVVVAMIFQEMEESIKEMDKQKTGVSERSNES